MLDHLADLVGHAPYHVSLLPDERLLLPDVVDD